MDERPPLTEDYYLALMDGPRRSVPIHEAADALYAAIYGSIPSPTQPVHLTEEWKAIADVLCVTTCITNFDVLLGMMYREPNLYRAQVYSRTPMHCEPEPPIVPEDQLLPWR